MRELSVADSDDTKLLIQSCRTDATAVFRSVCLLGSYSDTAVKHKTQSAQQGMFKRLRGLYIRCVKTKTILVYTGVSTCVSFVS